MIYGRVFVFHTPRPVGGKRRPKTKTPPYKMPNTTSLVLSMADESFHANYCKVFVFHTPRPLYGKRRPCSNLPEMTRRPQKPLGMLCLATLCSAFYVFVGVHPLCLFVKIQKFNFGKTPVILKHVYPPLGL